MICWNLGALVNGFNFSLVRFLCRWFLLWEPCDFDRSSLDDRLSSLVFRYTWRDPSSCSWLKSSTGAALSSGEMKVKLICLLGQFQHLNSTYLYLDFHLRSMAKLKEHSREICYNTPSGGRPRLESWHNHNSGCLQWLQVEHHIYYPYDIHMLSIYFPLSHHIIIITIQVVHNDSR